MLRLEFIVGLVVISCLLVSALVLTIIGHIEDKRAKTNMPLIDHDSKR